MTRYLYSVYNLAASWDDSGTDATRFQYAKTPSSSLSAWRKSLVNEALKIVRLMDEANWPAEGRWAVVTTEVKHHLLNFMINDAGTIGTGAPVDDAFINAEFSRMFGVKLYVDNQLPTAVAENNPYFLFGLNTGIYAARQINKLEAFRPENAFQDALKGLLTYGAVEAFAARKYSIVQAA